MIDTPFTQAKMDERPDWRKTHGMYNSRLNRIWRAMKQRCGNPKHSGYKWYGARGIAVCENWMSFEGFYADMGESYFDGATIDRRDPNVGYCKDNCEWVTSEYQQSHKRNDRKVLHDGKEYSLAELSSIYGIKHQTLYCRLFVNGWPVDKAISTKPSHANR